MSSDDILVRFAKRLKEIRTEMNLCQEDFADLCNVDRTYIGRLENSKRNPSLVILNRIANGLNMELSELLKI